MFSLSSLFLFPADTQAVFSQIYDYIIMLHSERTQSSAVLFKEGRVHMRSVIKRLVQRVDISKVLSILTQTPT